MSLIPHSTLRYRRRHSAPSLRVLYFILTVVLSPCRFRMINISSKNTSSTVRSRESCPSRSSPQSNLLFNPQRRQPTVAYGSSSDSGNLTPSSYWKARTAKLSAQAPPAVSQIFAGLTFYFNGRSGDKQTMHLKGAVCKHGGKTTPLLTVKGVTHIIAENLSGVKTDKAMKSLKTKVVHPDWLLRCMREGRMLPDAPYRVVRSQKLRVDDFFSPCKRERREHNESASRADFLGFDRKHSNLHRRSDDLAGSRAGAGNCRADTHTMISGIIVRENKAKGNGESISSPRGKRDRDGRLTGVKFDDAGCEVDSSERPLAVFPSSRSARGSEHVASAGAGSGAEEGSSSDLWETHLGEKRKRYRSSPPPISSVARV